MQKRGEQGEMGDVALLGDQGEWGGGLWWFLVWDGGVSTMDEKLVTNNWCNLVISLYNLVLYIYKTGFYIYKWH